MSSKKAHTKSKFYNGERVEIYDVVNREEKDAGNRTVIETKIWTVVKKYRHFVLMVDKHGIRECFSYWYLRKHMRMPRRVERIGQGAMWVWE